MKAITYLFIFRVFEPRYSRKSFPDSTVSNKISRSFIWISCRTLIERKFVCFRRKVLQQVRCASGTAWGDVTSVKDAVDCANRVNTVLYKGKGIRLFCAHDSADDTGDLELRTVQLETFFNSLKPSGHCMYHQFNIQQFYVLTIHCIYAFCVDLRRASTLYSAII
jgi:hypothetical protein